MSKSTQRRNLVVVALVIAVSLATWAYRLLDHRAIARETDQARSSASAWASPATTPDDARRWLESSGYRVIVWNPHHPGGFVGAQVSGSHRQQLIVYGQRQLRAGNWLVRPRWLDLTFCFALDGRYQDVQAKSSPLEISPPLQKS